MTQTKPIVMSILFSPHGTGRSAWLYPGAVDKAATSIAFHAEWAKKCEAAVFDLFFIADTPASRTDNLEIWSKSPMYQNVLEPLTLLSSVAMQTTHIGLGATVSSSFFEPFNIARQFASLDHISGGRACWNVVTSANDYAARNFGLDRLPPHPERYAKARECLEVVKAYWDTWEDDAFIYDKTTSRYFDPDKYHVVDHDGDYFKVFGGLNVARAPQGHPIIIQAGASEEGKNLAAETAEIVFGTGADIGKAKAFYADLKGRMARFGRDRDHLKILQGFAPVIGTTEEEALEKAAEQDACVPIEVRVNALGMDLEVSLMHLPLDEPIPMEIVPETANHHRVYFEHIVELIKKGGTLREIAVEYNRSAKVLAGTPEQIADHIEEWVREEACDGFMLAPRAVPNDLEDFIDLVVPILQDRGLMRRDYVGGTLREHLGLPRPGNVHVAAKAAE